MEEESLVELRVMVGEASARANHNISCTGTPLPVAAWLWVYCTAPIAVAMPENSTYQPEETEKLRTLSLSDLIYR